jgi:hypothetical protein
LKDVEQARRYFEEAMRLVPPDSPEARQIRQELERLR